MKICKHCSIITFIFILYSFSNKLALKKHPLSRTLVHQTSFSNSYFGPFSTLCLVFRLIMSQTLQNKSEIAVFSLHLNDHSNVCSVQYNTIQMSIQYCILTIYKDHLVFVYIVAVSVKSSIFLAFSAISYFLPVF